MYSFSYFQPICCSMSSSNCCFLTCIQISQEVGQVVWYSHLFQKGSNLFIFPPFWTSLPSPSPSHPSRLIQSLCLSFLSYTTNSRLLSILHMVISDNLICLLTSPYTGQEATFRTWLGTTDWFQIGKGVYQGCILSPCLFNLYAEYIMRNTGLEKA